jgi:hypothetical protein
VLAYLTARSCWGRRRGTLQWKGRDIVLPAPGGPP